MRDSRMVLPAWAVAIIVAILVALTPSPPQSGPWFEHGTGSVGVEQVQAPRPSDLAFLPESPLEVTSEAPASHRPAPRIDVCFCIDTTESMAGDMSDIRYAIEATVGRMDLGPPMPDVRYALVLFRDSGQEYVVKAHDFTTGGALRDLLDGVTTGHNDDYPEALAEALHAAVNELSWDPGADRAVYLFADAPPHSNASSMASLSDAASDAVAQGIAVHVVGMPGIRGHDGALRTIANATGGTFTYLKHYWPAPGPGADGATCWWAFSAEDDPCEEGRYGAEVLPAADAPIDINGTGQGQGQGPGQGQGQAQGQGNGQGQGQGQHGPDNLLSTLLKRVRDQGRAQGLCYEVDADEPGYDPMVVAH